MRGIVVASVTVFKEDMSLDLEAQRSVLLYAKKAGVVGVWCMGTTGEFGLLNDEEKLKVAKVCVDVFGENAIIGVHSNSTAGAEALARKYLDLGASKIFAFPPFPYRPSPLGVKGYFEALSKIGLPLYLYNYPGLTGVSLDPKFIAQLAEEGILSGMKYTTRDLPAFLESMEMIKGVSNDFNIFIGEDMLIAHSSVMGADGTVSAVANFAPELTVKVFTSASSGDLKSSFEMQKVINKISRVIGGGDYPAGVKVAMRARGLSAGTVRPPLREDMEQESKIYGVLRDVGL